MDYITIIMIIGAFIAVAYAIGYKKRKSHICLVEETADLINKEHQGELVGRIAYQGGLPQVPKPCFLYLGVAEDGVVLYDNQRLAAEVKFSNCVDAEKFSVVYKAGNFMKSTVMLGPLVPILFKDKIRHFITIEYIDIHKEVNNILFETTDKPMQKDIYDKILAGLKRAQLRDAVMN